MGLCSVRCGVASLMQGDSVPIPVYVTVDGAVAAPDNVDAVRVGLGQFTASWPNGTLTEQNGVWLFPLTEEQSYALEPGLNQVQAQVKKNGYVVGTAVTQVMVGKSHLRGAWT